MSHIPASLGAVLLFVTSLCLVPAAHAATPMHITGVAARPRTVSATGLVAFTSHVQGIRLSVKHIGKRSVAGEGHLQYYLDRVPKDAWSKADYHHEYLMSVGTHVVIFGLKTSRVKFSRGHHHILVALARNNGILYHAPVGRVTITVK